MNQPTSQRSLPHRQSRIIVYTLILDSLINVYTIITMEIEFDTDKSLSNASKHGVSLEAAEKLEWDMLLAIEDTREAYGELRFIGYAPIGRQVFCVVFTDRGDVRRIISLRKATRREVIHYANQI